MPNQRGEDQKLLPFTVKEEFLDELDRALRSLHITNRSQFIRDAIREKLSALGVEVPEGLAAAADRFGKGGPKPRTITSYREDAKKEKRRKKP